ncbi:MAG: hypothetical protein EPN25_02545 [Nitrospirae bacterium]|nr:MAG: hypothetical protein EPN25_02545 [Nitrospirota bacterium]
MKPLVRLALGIGLLMIFGITSLVCAADVTPRPGLKAGTVKKLPATIKINPSDIKLKLEGGPSAEFKATWKIVGEQAAIITNTLPVLDQKITQFNAKVEECMGKVYTTTDMTAAGCVDTDTIQYCSRKLLVACVHDSWNQAILTAGSIANAMEMIRQKMPDSGYMSGIFQKWYVELRKQGEL